MTPYCKVSPKFLIKKSSKKGFIFFNPFFSHWSVNACLQPICSLHCAAVVTVEGIGSTKTKLHPVQVNDSPSHTNYKSSFKVGILSRQSKQIKYLSKSADTLIKCYSSKSIKYSFSILLEEKYKST